MDYRLLATISCAPVAVIAVSWAAKRGLRHLTAKTKGTLDDSLVPSVMRVLRVVLWVLALVFVLANLGVDMSAAYGVLGVLALAASQALALAVKGIVADFIAGIQMAINPPFSIGQGVEVAGKEGTVKEVTLLRVSLAHENGDLASVPNSEIMKKIIIRRER